MPSKYTICAVERDEQDRETWTPIAFEVAGNTPQQAVQSWYADTIGITMPDGGLVAIPSSHVHRLAPKVDNRPRLKF